MKLTDKEVDEIRAAYDDRQRIRQKLIDEYSNKALAAEHGVSLCQIERIVGHHSRRHGL